MIALPFPTMMVRFLISNYHVIEWLLNFLLDTSFCNPGSCLHRGICHLEGAGLNRPYTCECNKGFYGDICELGKHYSIKSCTIRL